MVDMTNFKKIPFETSPICRVFWGLAAWLWAYFGSKEIRKLEKSQSSNQLTTCLHRYFAKEWKCTRGFHSQILSRHCAISFWLPTVTGEASGAVVSGFVGCLRLGNVGCQVKHNIFQVKHACCTCLGEEAREWGWISSHWDSSAVQNLAWSLNASGGGRRGSTCSRALTGIKLPEKCVVGKGECCRRATTN